MNLVFFSRTEGGAAPDPEAMLRDCLGQKLQGVVYSDRLWAGEVIAGLGQRLGLPKHFRIFPAQQVTVPELGEVLVLAATARLPAEMTLPALRETAPCAALIWLHPYHQGRKPGAGQLAHPILDAIEIVCSRQTLAENCRALRAWHALKFTGLAGSDASGLRGGLSYPTSFDHPIATVEELATEIKAGRCRPLVEEVPASGTTETKVTEVAFGQGVPPVPPARCIVKEYHHPEPWQVAARAGRLAQAWREKGFEAPGYRLPHTYAADPEDRTVVEEKIAGEHLARVLEHSPADRGIACLEQAGRWLARLHNTGLRLDPAERFLDEENRRLHLYYEPFARRRHPRLAAAARIKDAVLAAERSAFARGREAWVQGHGDYHLGNIVINPGLADSAAISVAAIDLDNSLVFPRALDVGTFLAHFRILVQDLESVRRKVDETVFLKAYGQALSSPEPSLSSQAELFAGRAYLSICFYLFKVGKDRGPELDRALDEADRSLARYHAAGAKA